MDYRHTMAFVWFQKEEFERDLLHGWHALKRYGAGNDVLLYQYRDDDDDDVKVEWTDDDDSVER